MQPRRLVAFEIHFGGEGGHRDGTLAQDVSNIVDVVGAFLQKQPAGEGGVPVPAVIVNAAVRHIVDGLHGNDVTQRAAVHKALHLLYDAGDVQRERDHNAASQRGRRGQQPGVLRFIDAYGLFQEQGQAAFHHKGGVPGVQAAPGADEHGIQRLTVQHLLRVRVIAGVCKAAVTGQLRLQRFQARVRDSGRRERKARAGKCFHHGLAAQAVADKADFFHGDSFFQVFFDAHARTALHLL